MASLYESVCLHPEVSRLVADYGLFCVGPNILSINSASAISVIYGPRMTKGDAYTGPGRAGDVALFFKQDEDVHAKRKALWNNALSGAAYVYFSYLPSLTRLTCLI